MPKQFSISHDNQSAPCSSTCYKHERKCFKRSLSPSYAYEQQHNGSQTSISTSSETAEDIKKRRRKSVPINCTSSKTNLFLSRNENLRINFSLDHQFQAFDTQKKHASQQLLARIENHLVSRCSNELSHESQQQQQTILMKNWTLSDHSLFRLFYFVFDGDLCLISQLFNDRRTCQDIYQQFILDAKFFSDRVSQTNGSPFSIRQPYRRRMLEGATRAFLFHIKKHTNNNYNTNDTNNQKSTTLKRAYRPCLHNGPCTISNLNCHCMQNGTYCEKYCNCSIDCSHRFPGCSCKGACLLNNCLCCAEGRECDPDLCHKCGASSFLNSTDNLNPIIKS